LARAVVSYFISQTFIFETTSSMKLFFFFSHKDMSWDEAEKNSLYWPCSVYLMFGLFVFFFSQNIIFLSQQFSQNSFFSVSFSQVQTSERNHNICLGQLQRQGLLEGAASWPYHFPTVGR